MAIENFEEKIYLPKDNSEIEKYLDYYIKLDKPGYAVFLNGPWGSGKTWFIRKFKEEKGEDQFVHISLYGVVSADEVEGQIFQKLYPRLTSSKGKFVIKGIKSLTGLWSSALDDIDLRDYLKTTTEKILIFDDLERCDNANAILGVINRYIELNGNRVIVIGEEEFLKSKESEFIRQKEKTIGRNFTIYPDFEATFLFLANIPAHNSIRTPLIDNKDRIKDCFLRADCQNLRTLRFCISEFFRFFENLPEKAQQNKDFLSETINTFFSLCIELRSGKLDANDICKIDEAYSSDLTSRVTRNLGDNKEPEINPLAELRKLHFGDGWDKIQPNLKLFFCFFKYGSVHPEMLKEAIDNCSWFHVDNTPDWVRFWYSHSIPDSVFENCYASVLKDFKDFKFTEIGVIEHVVGMLLNYSKEEMIDLTYEEVLKVIESVVNEMIQKKLIEVYKENDFSRAFDDVSHGMQFQSLNDPNFKSISEKIKQGALVKKDEQNKQIAKEIPGLLKDNVISLWPILTAGGESQGKERLYKYPVMQYVDLDAFVQALEKMNPANGNRFTIFSIFKDRYQLVSHYPALKEDLEWLKNLQKKMDQRMVSLKQPTKNHFKSMLVNLKNIIALIEPPEVTTTSLKESPLRP